MAIPDFQTIMLPLIRHMQDGREHATGETLDALAEHFKLKDEERRELLPSGIQAVFTNRVAWAKSHLKKAGVLASPRRGVYQITARGREILAGSPTAINLRFLYRFPEYQSFRAIHRQRAEESEDAETNQGGTPEEALESAHAKTQENLAADLLQRLMACSSQFFERLVVEVIVKMGYGGSRHDAGKAIGKSGDGGIDGIIKEDKLGLDAIYIQAKRWANTVGRPEIQKFVGALTGQRAKKGLFITTSDFTADAKTYALQIDTKIVLIDGEMLAQLMIDYNVGVSTIATYELKKIDTDYFTEE
ncbi:MAG: Mrr restriction system protein [Betaproteobacteria bacterium ADurb.Bin341]|nr:MAG: Mrr restriction system protein [Betaproteobacteria bacterium ADurb.Bin341]